MSSFSHGGGLRLSTSTEFARIFGDLIGYMSIDNTETLRMKGPVVNGLEAPVCRNRFAASQSAGRLIIAARSQTGRPHYGRVH